MIKYYNGMERLTRVSDIISPEFNADEKYCVNRGATIQNSAFNVGQQLPLAKAIRAQEVRDRTGVLIVGGVTTSKGTFSTDEHAQLNWNSLLADISGTTFPYYIANSDGVPVAFADADEVLVVFRAGKVKKEGFLASQAILLGQIIAATTFAELNAIIDNR